MKNDDEISDSAMNGEGERKRTGDDAMVKEDERARCLIRLYLIICLSKKKNSSAGFNSSTALLLFSPLCFLITKTLGFILGMGIFLI